MMQPMVKELTIRRKVFHCRLCGADFDTQAEFYAHAPECERLHTGGTSDLVGRTYVRQAEGSMDVFKVDEVRAGAAYGFLASFTRHDGGIPERGTRNVRQSYRSVDVAELGTGFEEVEPGRAMDIIRDAMESLEDILESIYSPADTDREVA